MSLGVLAAAYVEDWIEPPHQIGALPTPVLWFGAVGAVLLSFNGIFDHVNDWEEGYVLWHVARPFIGATVAVVAVLIVIAGILAVGSNPDPTATAKKPSDTFYFLVAFLVGYREETFRDLVQRLGDVILAPGETPPSTGAGRRSVVTVVSDVNPPTGRAGDVVGISGSGLEGATDVQFGSVSAPSIDNASDTSLDAVVPPGEAGSEVEVVVTTPSGPISGPTFRYLP